MMCMMQNEGGDRGREEAMDAGRQLVTAMNM